MTDEIVSSEIVSSIADVESLFDPEYYRTRYADISANPQIDPLQHFCSVGWKQGRNPTNWFSTKQYLASHPDVATAGVNPFVHYALVRRNSLRRLERSSRIDEPIEYVVDEAVIDRHGILRVTGWIVTFAPLREIIVSFSGRKLGMAQYGLPREDVGAVYANYPEANRSGFSFIQELEDDCTDPLVTIDIAALGGLKRQLSIVPTVASTIQRQKRRITKIRYHVDLLSLSDTGTLIIEGWAISSDGINGIHVDLDGEAIGRAVIGLSRPDVGNAHPQIPSARWGGFRISKNLDRRFTGEHLVILTIQHEGETRAVSLAVMAHDQHDVSIRFYLDSPKAENDSAIEPVYGDLAIAGWAVAPSGIDHIEVFVDGEPKGNAYYGSRRLDIKAAFPSIPGAALSGFGMSVPNRWEPGRHELKLVLYDRGGNAQQQEITFESRPADESHSRQLRRKVTQAEIDTQLAICNALECHPEFLLILQVRNALDWPAAEATIKSLRDQAYQTWRLLVICPSKVGPFTDSRIQQVKSWDSFDDSLVGLLRAGDVLGADALLEVAVNAALHRHARIFYSDERRYDFATKTVMPYYKPDWSPDLFLSTNYLGRFWVARGGALGAIRFRLADLSRGEYDLLLRLTDADCPVHHIAKLLCVAVDRTDTEQQEKRALRAALQRRSIAACVIEGCAPHYYRVQRKLQTNPLVSIIIPTIAAKGLIKIAITSIREKTMYSKFEIICIDGIAEDNELKPWVQDNADVIIQAPKKFNWSRCNNLGVAKAGGDIFVFLNDDIEITDPYWLHALLEHAQRPEVGVVGPMLLYPEGKIQHAGLVLQAGDKHVFRFAGGNDPGPFGLIQTQRNVIAVTGACMMVARAAYVAVGGFDEAHPVINNDTDFCLRCGRNGLRVIYTPHTRLVHYEETSRAELRDTYDVERFDQMWRRQITLGDPYSSPHLSQDNDGYRPETEVTEVLHVGHPVIAAADVKRILAVKLDHIGDFITAIPAFDTLRQRFPHAEITALVGKASGALARSMASIDRVLEFQFFRPRSGDGRYKMTPSRIAELTALLAPYRFDVAIDLRQQMDTREILKYPRATWLAGYDLRGSAPWLDITLELVVDTRMEAKRTHVSDALLQMVEALAVACNASRSTFPSQSRITARGNFAALPGMAELAENLFAAPLICMHPGVGSPTRQWPAKHFADLANLLIEGEAAKVMIIGSPNEFHLAKQVMRGVAAKDSIVSLIGKTRVGDLPQVLQSSDLFIGNNSGPHHIAAGLGVPTIGVHSGVVDATEWGPLGVNAVAIRRRMNCSPCYLERLSDCHRGHACMTGLLPREVYKICQRLLALRATPTLGGNDGILDSVFYRKPIGRTWITAIQRRQENPDL